jgi:hypothetical protein
VCVLQLYFMPECVLPFLHTYFLQVTPKPAAWDPTCAMIPIPPSCFELVMATAWCSLKESDLTGPIAVTDRSPEKLSETPPFTQPLALRERTTSASHLVSLVHSTTYVAFT